MSGTPEQAAAGSVAGLVLAAGKGTRMRSAVPKVLQPVAGRPMLEWTLRALDQAGIGAVCLVLSEERKDFAAFLASWPQLNVAVQRNRLGTGDAVAAAAWSFAGVEPAPFASGYAAQGAPLECQYVLILAGDVPGIEAGALTTFIAETTSRGAQMAVLGMNLAQPTGYGRMQTKGGDLLAITEEKDADQATRLITLCNTGIMLVDKQLLFSLLPELSAQNAQKEYYLTDCVQLARRSGHRVLARVAADASQFQGINDRQQLAEVEERLIARKRRELQLAGVSLQLPATIYVEPSVEVGADTLIASGCHLSGRTRIGAGCVIGAGTVLRNTTISPGEHVPPLSVRIHAES